MKKILSLSALLLLLSLGQQLYAANSLSSLITDSIQPIKEVCSYGATLTAFGEKLKSLSKHNSKYSETLALYNKTLKEFEKIKPNLSEKNKSEIDELLTTGKKGLSDINTNGVSSDGKSSLELWSAIYLARCKNLSEKLCSTTKE